MEIDAQHVIAVLREQLADLTWQVTLLRAQLAQQSQQPAATEQQPVPRAIVMPEP